ncbi:CDP-glycerol glycerophosphotransferase family protein [Bacteroidota bacterium]
MKAVLFCENPYAFGILEPIMNVLKEQGDEFLWFVKTPIVSKFPFVNEPHTSNMNEVAAFMSDAIFVPGNEVPYYLRGLKTQVFHGLAGEKKGHFRIRNYFDLYLTQGPFFTEGFKKLKTKTNNIEVIETGWPKLDVFGKDFAKYDQEKEALLKEYAAKKIILYAPTFSPSLTCAPFLLNEIEELASNKDYLVLIKFHDLMAQDLIEQYKKLASRVENIVFEDERNVIKFLLISDLMISDTSSVVYEFLLLDKPVITFKNFSKNIRWDNALEYANVSERVKNNLEEDPFKVQRKEIYNQYHPYNDGNSALRMVTEVKKYIAEHGVPEKRKLSFWRRRKIHKIFGKLNA